LRLRLTVTSQRATHPQRGSCSGKHWMLTRLTCAAPLLLQRCARATAIGLRFLLSSKPSLPSGPDPSGAVRSAMRWTSSETSSLRSRGVNESPPFALETLASSRHCSIASRYLRRTPMVSANSLICEIASDFYHGGCVYPDDASVDPTRLLLALLRRALDSGASVVDRCAVEAISRTRDGFEVSTARGIVRARQVLLATNGYSGPLSPWARRRVIPIGSYQIATGPLGRGRVRELIPRGRNIVDSRRVVVYFRPSADGERIIFGGRAALADAATSLPSPICYRTLPRCSHYDVFSHKTATEQNVLRKPRSTGFLIRFCAERRGAKSFLYRSLG